MVRIGQSYEANSRVLLNRISTTRRRENINDVAVISLKHIGSMFHDDLHIGKKRTKIDQVEKRTDKVAKTAKQAAKPPIYDIFSILQA